MYSGNLVLHRDGGKMKQMEGMQDNAGHRVLSFKLDTVFKTNLPSALKGPGWEQTTYFE